MNEAAIRDRLIDLGKLMTSLRTSGAVQLGEEGLYCCDKAEDKQAVEELMDRLRVQLKYLVFDLEATRRENRYLRQMLDTRPRPRTDEDFGGPST